MAKFWTGAGSLPSGGPGLAEETPHCDPGADTGRHPDRRLGPARIGHAQDLTATGNSSAPLACGSIESQQDHLYRERYNHPSHSTAANVNANTGL